MFDAIFCSVLSIALGITSGLLGYVLWRSGDDIVEKIFGTVFFLMTVLGAVTLWAGLTGRIPV